MPSSLRREHLIVAAAYVVGYPLLAHVAHLLGLFDFLVPIYTVGELVAMGLSIPHGMNPEQTMAYASCAATLMCEAAMAAYRFIPLAIVWQVMRGLPGQGSRARAEHPEHPNHTFIVALALCLVLVPVADVLVLGNLVSGGGAFTYAERWRFLPQLGLIVHLGYAVAAYLAARQCARLSGATPSEQVFDAVRDGNAEALVELLNTGADPNAARDENAATPLHVAVTAGHIEVVHALLAGKADSNATDGDGNAPLHIAASAGALQAIVALATEGADLNARDAEGATALHRAASGGHADAVVYLLEFGADASLTDNAGRSAVDLWSGPRDEVFEELSAVSDAQAGE